MRGQFVRGVVGTAGVKVAARFLGLLAGMAMARLLGAEGYGVYSFAMAVVTLLAIPVQLGMPHFVVRQVAVYLQRGELRLMKGLLRTATMSVTTAGVVICAVASFIVAVWIGEGGAVRPNVLTLAFVILPFVGLCALRSASLRGLGRVVIGQVPDDLVRPGLFLLLVAAFAMFRLEIGPLQGIQLQLLATIAAFIVGSLLLYRLRPSGLDNCDPQYEVRSWASGAGPFLALALTYAITQQTDVVMLGMMVEGSDVGIYRVASIMAPLTAFGLLLVETSIAPHLARHHDAAEHSKLQKLISAGALAALLMGLPVALLLIFGGGVLLPVLFGEEFGPATGPLSILSIGYLVNAATGPGAMVLAMTGHTWIGTASVGGAAAANVALNLILIPRLGVSGAATATSLSLSLANLALVYGLYQKTGLVCLPLWKSGK